MRILNRENPEMPVNIQSFIDTGEYDQGDVALIDYDELYDFIQQITKATDAPEPIIKPLQRWKP